MLISVALHYIKFLNVVYQVVVGFFTYSIGCRQPLRRKSFIAYTFRLVSLAWIEYMYSNGSHPFIFHSALSHSLGYIQVGLE